MGGMRLGGARTRGPGLGESSVTETYEIRVWVRNGSGEDHVDYARMTPAERERLRDMLNQAVARSVIGSFEIRRQEPQALIDVIKRLPVQVLQAMDASGGRLAEGCL